MTTNTLFSMFTLSMLFIAKVRCSSDSSPLELLLSTTASRNSTSTIQEDSVIHDFQSNFTFENQNNRDESCTIEINPSGQPETFKFRFQRNSTFATCNFSRPLPLNYNGVDNLNSDVLDQLIKFATLILEHNNLDSLNLTISQGSNRLETLDIDTNNLFKLSPGIFRELIDLETIKLNANNFSDIPTSLFVHNTRIKIIELTQNKVDLMSLPSRLFGGFTDLKVVLLRNNGIQRLTEDLFWGSHNLEELDLSENFLRVLPKDLLRDARELKTLNVSSNHFTTLSNGIFVAANRLNQLDLSGNQITALDSSDLFVGLDNLQMLNIQNNGLKFIHADAFASLPNLKYANFAHNYLNLTTGVYDSLGQMSPFRHCHLLEELDMSSNNVTGMFRDWIVIHNVLRKLDLSRNQFSYLESNDMRFNSNNLFVDLTFNQIKNVNLTQLEKIPKTANSGRNVVIDLNNNPIECYCDVHSLVVYAANKTSDWLKAEDLNYVKLITNELVCQEPFTGWGINHLYEEGIACGVHQRVDACTSIPSCICMIFPKFSTLTLNCQERNLTEAPSSIYSWHIQSAYVNFSGNALQKTPDIRKGGYESPKELYLDLSRNQINRIEDYSVNKNLRELNVAHNNMTVPPSGSSILFMAFEIPKLHMKIRENPWPCNEVTLWFREWTRNLFVKYDFWKYWDMKDFTCNHTATLFPLGYDYQTSEN